MCKINTFYYTNKINLQFDTTKNYNTLKSDLVMMNRITI